MVKKRRFFRCYEINAKLISLDKELKKGYVENILQYGRGEISLMERVGRDRELARRHDFLIKCERNSRKNPLQIFYFSDRLLN